MPVLRTKPSVSDITLNLSQNTTANITLTFPALHMNNNVTIYNLDGSVNSEFTVTFPIEITMEDVTFSKITLNDSQFNYEVFYTLQLNNYQTNAEYQSAISQSYMNVTTIPYTAPPVFAFGSINYGTLAYTDEEYVIPITVSNNQSIATGTDFQLLLQFTPSSLSADINPNCQNIAFLDSGDNKLQSWIENATSLTTSGSVNIWVNLGNNNINPNSSTTIYMAIGNATTVNYLDNPANVGAQPNYTTTYGEYDNGANTFNFYDNFAGTTLNTTKWTVMGTPTYAVDNGLTETAVTNADFIASATSYDAQTNILETFGYEESTTDNNRFFTWNNAQTAGNGMYFEGINTTEQSFCDQATGNTYAFTGTTIGSTTPAIYSMWTDTAATEDYGMFNYVFGSVSSATSLATAWIGLGGANSTTNFYQWVRMRSVPPNNTMPSVTFGSVQPITQPTVTIYPTNTGLLYFKGQVYNTGSSAVTFSIDNPDGSTAYSLEVPANSPPETFEFYSPNWEINFQYVFTFTNNLTFNYFLCRETY